MEKGSYDVAVMGSGMGGLSAAALLAHAGYHTLLIEKRERLGGKPVHILAAVCTGRACMERSGANR